MKRRFIPILLTAIGLASTAFSADATPGFGIVNFGSCVTDSKLGKQEQASFESLKKQMTTLLEDTEKQLNDLAAKFNDPEYLDGHLGDPLNLEHGQFRMAQCPDVQRYFSAGLFRNPQGHKRSPRRGLSPHDPLAYFPDCLLSDAFRSGLPPSD